VRPGSNARDPGLEHGILRVGRERAGALPHLDETCLRLTDCCRQDFPAVIDGAAGANNLLDLPHLCRAEREGHVNALRLRNGDGSISLEANAFTDALGVGHVRENQAGKQ
jgi:hypothetical protein